jgi:hypothetical protein
MSSKTSSIGLLARKRLDEHAHREEELLAIVDAAVGIEPHQDRQVPGDRLGVHADG